MDYNKFTYFIITSESVYDTHISNFNENPNIGGTEFVMIQLAFELAKNFRSYYFEILTLHQFTIKNKPPNLNLSIIKDQPNIINGASIILSSLSISWLNSIKTSTNRIILWSHHPHDFMIKNADFKISELVSIGSYQYFSNYLIYGKHSRIENIPPTISYKPKSISNKNFENFMFIGSYAPAKGLKSIIKIFPKIHKIFPNSKLNIIGGSIYTSKKSIIPKHIQRATDSLSSNVRKKIIFHGAIKSGKNKIIKCQDIALLNPTGQSEAFPASVLECYYQGIPVIASADYGMSEFIPNKSPIALRFLNSYKKSLQYLNDFENFSAERKRMDILVRNYLTQRRNILVAWKAVILGNVCISNRAQTGSLTLKIYLRHLIGFLKYYYRKYVKFL